MADEAKPPVEPPRPSAPLTQADWEAFMKRLEALKTEAKPEKE